MAYFGGSWDEDWDEDEPIKKRFINLLEELLDLESQLKIDKVVEKFKERLDDT